MNKKWLILIAVIILVLISVSYYLIKTNANGSEKIKLDNLPLPPAIDGENLNGDGPPSPPTGRVISIP